MVLEQIDELLKLKISIMQKIKTAGNRVLQNVEVGMTIGEVIKLAGMPRAQTDDLWGTHYNYGQVWIIFDNAYLFSCVSSKQRCR